MAKQRNDYENSWFPRLRRWIAQGGTGLNDRMTAELSEASDAHRVLSADDIARREVEQAVHQLEIQEHEAVLYEKAHDWGRTKGARIIRALYVILAVVMCLSVIVALLTTVSNLPSFGGENNPINNEVSQR